MARSPLMMSQFCSAPSVIRLCAFRRRSRGLPSDRPKVGQTKQRVGQHHDQHCDENAPLGLPINARFPPLAEILGAQPGIGMAKKVSQVAESEHA